MMTNGLTKYVSDWFARGDDDLALVELVLEKKTGSANLACFHLQQAAEKYLKGFLAYRDLHVRKIHDLETLFEDCKIVDADFVQLQDDVRLLNRFYTESRYPDDYIEFNWQDVESAYAAILRIKEFVMQKIQPPKTSGGFGLIGIIIALAVVVLAGGGGLYWKEMRNQKLLLQSGNDAVKQAEDLKEKINGQNKVVVDEPAIDTSNWKTYRNEQAGYQFKYPDNWRAQSVEYGGVILNSVTQPTNFFEVAIDYGGPNIIELDGHVARVPAGAEVVHIESSQFIFSGISAIREIRQENYEYYISPTNNKPHLSPKIFTSIFFSSNIPGTTNTEHFKIQFSPPLDVFIQILSTFKFLK